MNDPLLMEGHWSAPIHRSAMPSCRRKASMASVHSLSPADVAIIKYRLKLGEFQHRIAADYGLNQGRISEIAKGKRFADIRPADEVGHA